MKICVVGTGYVGLVTGACLSEKGYSVTCLDIDHEKIYSLRQGHLPFYEPGLEELVASNVAKRRLFFSDDYEEATEDCDICFLALPTPMSADGSCNLSYVFQAAEQLGKVLQKPTIIVNKSTAPIGTVEKIREIIADKSHVTFDIVANPEFLREGSAIKDCLFPSRVVLGLESKKTAEVMKNLYKPFEILEDRLIITDIATAEIAKYAANIMLASRISTINHLARVTEKMGGDIEDVCKIIGTDERIGKYYLNPGLGFGGSCFPKDIKALNALSERNGLPTAILDAIVFVNEAQKEHFFQKVQGYFGSLENKTLAVWGLSFKPNTDDLREAPSLDIIKNCLKDGARLRLYDPASMAKAKKILKPTNQVKYCESPYEAATGADAILLLTEWSCFRDIDLEKIGSLAKTKILFDGRNQFSPKKMQSIGFEYFCIGKGGEQKTAVVESKSKRVDTLPIFYGLLGAFALVVYLLLYKKILIRRIRKRLV